LGTFDRWIDKSASLDCILCSACVLVHQKISEKQIFHWEKNQLHCTTYQASPGDVEIRDCSCAIHHSSFMAYSKRCTDYF
jgi:hypothetical protein